MNEMKRRRSAPRLTLAVIVTLGLVPSQARAEAGYDGGFVISDTTDSGQTFQLKIGGRLQTRLTWLPPDDALGEDDSVAFMVPRARLALAGHIWTKALTFKLQTDFGKGSTSLKDFYLDYAFSDAVALRIGRYKKPFSRQQLTSNGKLELVDRSITDKAFAAGRDIGLTLHNNYESTKGSLEWALGIFNGTSNDGGETPDTIRPEIVARVGYQSEGFGSKRYSEGDLECTTEKPERCGFRWAIAGGAIIDGGGGVNDDGDPVEGQVEANVDFIFKVAHFAMTGAFYLDNNLGDDSGLKTLGVHAQASYTIASAHIQPAVRYARVWSAEDGGPTRQELAIGVSAYFMGHSLKWQNDFTALTDEVGGASTTKLMVRSQIQLAF